MPRSRRRNWSYQSFPKVGTIPTAAAERVAKVAEVVGKGPITTPATVKWLRQYRVHLLEREYMSGVKRDRARIKATAEVFTPDEMVRQLVFRHGKDDVSDPEKRIIDSACGDGQFLAYILYCRLEAEVPLLDALKTLYGIEKMADNVMMCRQRLNCGHGNGSVFEVINRNTVHADALTYHMRFDGSSPSDQSSFGF